MVLAQRPRRLPALPAAVAVGRARLAWFVVQCQLRRRWDSLEDRPLLPWLRRHCGKAVVERIWKPLLDSRFDGRHDELPATYMWARTNRMRSARTGQGSGETMGCIEGGHETLVDAIAERARSLGVDIRVDARVEGLDARRRRRGHAACASTASTSRST